MRVSNQRRLPGRFAGRRSHRGAMRRAPKHRGPQRRGQERWWLRFRPGLLAVFAWRGRRRNRGRVRGPGHRSRPDPAEGLDSDRWPNRRCAGFLRSWTPRRRKKALRREKRSIAAVWIRSIRLLPSSSFRPARAASPNPRRPALVRFGPTRPGPGRTKPPERTARWVLWVQRAFLLRARLTSRRKTETSALARQGAPAPWIARKSLCPSPFPVPARPWVPLRANPATESYSGVGGPRCFFDEPNRMDAAFSAIALPMKSGDAGARLPRYGTHH